jgi:hypothetical protein
MQWDHNLVKEILVLRLQWRGKPWGDRWEDLQEFCESIVCLVLIGYLEEQVHNLLTYFCPQCHKFPINSVQYSLEIISLTRVLRIEKVQKLFDKRCWNAQCNGRSRNISCHNELEEKFVHKLQVRPCFFQMRFVLVRVNSGRLFVCYSIEVNSEFDS